MANFLKGLTAFSPVAAVAKLLNGGAGGTANWNAATGYTNQAKNYLGQIDTLTPQYNNIAGQARTNVSTYAPIATQANLRYLDYLGRPAGSSVEDQAAVAQATRGTTDAWARGEDAVRQTFAERGLTGSAAETAALGNLAARRVNSVAGAVDARAMQNVAQNRQNMATRADFANNLTNQAQGQQLQALGLVGQNAGIGLNTNLALASDSRQLAAQQDAQKAQRQAQVFAALGSIVPLLTARNRSIGAATPTVNSTMPFGGTTGANVGVSAAGQPTVQDIARMLQSAGLI